MDRRAFITGGVAASAALISVPGLAADKDLPAHWDNVAFDASNPGHWKDVESLHVPKTQVEAGVLHVTTPHPMSDDHYIVSHTVVLAEGKFLGRKTFTPKDQPVSTHKLPDGYRGEVIVTSTCNLHDFWVKRFTV